MRKVDLPSFFTCETSEKIRKPNFQVKIVGSTFFFADVNCKRNLRDVAQGFLHHVEKLRSAATLN